MKKLFNYIKGLAVYTFEQHLWMTLAVIALTLGERELAAFWFVIAFYFKLHELLMEVKSKRLTLSFAEADLS